MKAILAALVVGLAPFRVTLGPVSLPVPWLLAAAETILGAVSIWLAVRAIRRFRSWPYLRPAGGALWST